MSQRLGRLVGPQRGPVAQLRLEGVIAPLQFAGHLQVEGPFLVGQRGLRGPRLDALELVDLVPASQPCLTRVWRAQRRTGHEFEKIDGACHRIIAGTVPILAV
ncbi:MAG: hypothetical protein ACRDRK_26970 [Pseudonocardia sp.]